VKEGMERSEKGTENDQEGGSEKLNVYSPDKRLDKA
jgi:hypothetical protein